MTALPAGYRHEAFPVLPSTNDAVLERLVGGDVGGLWITAESQSAGRGRRGNVWSSRVGNLFASLGLVDPAPAEKAATLSFVSAVALHQALVDVCGPGIVDRLALKWPNDVLLDRHKIAGILIEGQPLSPGRFAVVAGIGVNCEHHPGTTGPFPSASLAGLGYRVRADEMFTALAASLANEIVRWDRGAGFADTRAAWLGRATGIGAPVTVRLPDSVREGVFRDIDDEGRLVLGLPGGGTTLITAGEIFFRQRAET